MPKSTNITITRRKQTFKTFFHSKLSNSSPPRGSVREGDNCHLHTDTILFLYVIQRVVTFFLFFLKRFDFGRPKKDESSSSTTTWSIIYISSFTPIPYRILSYFSKVYLPSNTYTSTNALVLLSSPQRIFSVFFSGKNILWLFYIRTTKKKK